MHFTRVLHTNSTVECYQLLTVALYVQLRWCDTKVAIEYVEMPHNFKSGSPDPRSEHSPGG